MHKRNKRKSKYLIIILILMVLFFILFNIQTEENSKNGTTIEKVNSKLYQNYQSENLETQQSTTNEQNVEKEYIETEFKGYKVCAKLNIPIINLETYVLEEYSKQALLTSVTKFYGGEPNKVGNFCIAGHNYGPTNMFQNIKKLKVNDEISDILDEVNYIKDQYFLEVSSPGIERILRKDKHLEQNKGKEIYVKLFRKDDSGNKEYQGILQDFNEEYIFLENDIKIERKHIAQIKTIYHWD